MSDNERGRIESEVRKLVAGLLPQECGCAPCSEPQQEQILAFLTEPLAYPGLARQAVCDSFGEDTAFISFGLAGCAASEQTAQDSEPQLTQRVADCEGVLLLAPGVPSLLRLARGESAILAEKLVLRALLWEKPVWVWLDFAPRRMHKSPFFRDVSDAVQALEAMGMNLSEELWAIHTGKAAKQPLAFVTEQDVLQVENGTELVCAKNAVITPLARDRASQNNIRIRKEH